ncbi:MAG TPA: hypothetical protein GX708_24380 [Gallicola sp.]|nr:hypothetical protein [Gallicola sp.]
MKKFKVGTSYRVWGTVEVEAETLEQAIEYAKNHKEYIELPINPEYIEGSFEIDDDLEFAKSFQN